MRPVLPSMRSKRWPFVPLTQMSLSLVTETWRVPKELTFV